MTTPANQVCVRCRQPFAAGGRKDRFGNSYCQPCAEALIAAADRMKRGAAPASSGAALSQLAEQRRASQLAVAGTIPIADSPAQPQSAEPTRPGDAPVDFGLSQPPGADGPVLLAPDGTITLEPEDPTVKPKMRVCEKCSKTVNADVAVCAYCGYDARKGPPTKFKAPAHKCRHCGYDLAGLIEPVCPECGNRNARPSSRPIAVAQDSAETTKAAYRRPLIMLGIGLGGLLLMAMIQSALAGGFMGKVLLIPLKYLVVVPIGLSVYFVCCMIWIGFDMPMRLVALRLAAIYAVVDLISAVGDTLGLFNIIVWPIILITYVGLLMEELDLEFQDAVILTVLTGFAKYIIAAILIAVLHAYGII